MLRSIPSKNTTASKGSGLLSSPRVTAGEKARINAAGQQRSQHDDHAGGL